MKEIKFKTSKGEFVVYDDANGIGKHLPYDLLTKIGYIKNLTEEQAIDIVDSLMSGNVLGKLFTGLENHRIEIYQHEGKNIKFIRAVNCLHSLLKSKGIHLYRNPLNTGTSIEDYDKYKEAEAKTLHNPYIFKRND